MSSVKADHNLSLGAPSHPAAMDSSNTGIVRLEGEALTGTVCERYGCNAKATRIHHTLRDIEEHKKLVPHRGQQSISVRNQSQYLQNLCEKHHHTEFHELFQDTGGWPENYGYLDREFRRNHPEVEDLIAQAMLRGRRPV